MNFNHFANFILHEEITSKGKPLTDPDEKKDDQVPEFGNDEEDPTDGNDAPDTTTDKTDDTGDTTNTPPEPEANDNTDTLDAGTDDTTPDATKADNTTPAAEPPAPTDNATTGADTTAPTAPDTTDTTPAADNTDTGDTAAAPDAGTDDTTPDAGEEDDDVPDFGEDAGDAADDDTGGDGTDPNAADGEQPPATADAPDNMQPDEIKQLEDELFASLSPEQVEMKKTELKSQFVKLYDTIDKTIERLSKSDRKSSDISALNFVTKKLFDLKELLKTSLVDNFDSKSYVENQIILQRHMAIFVALTNIIEEIGKKKDKDVKK